MESTGVLCLSQDQWVKAFWLTSKKRQVFSVAILHFQSTIQSLFDRFDILDGKKRVPARFCSEGGSNLTRANHQTKRNIKKPRCIYPWDKVFQHAKTKIDILRCLSQYNSGNNENTMDRLTSLLHLTSNEELVL